MVLVNFIQQVLVNSIYDTGKLHKVHNIVKGANRKLPPPQKKKKSGGRSERAGLRMRKENK